MIYEIPGRSFDQRSLQSVQAQPIPFNPVSGRWQRRLEVEKRRSVRQPCHAVGALGRAYGQLAGNGDVPNLDRQRLFRRQAPVLVEPVLQIGRGETPEGGIPRRAFTLAVVRTARDIPALHDLLQKAVLQKALPVSPGQVARTDGGRAVGVLELVQNLKGFGQFFGRGRHDVSQLGFRVVLKLGYSVVAYLGYAVEHFLGLCAPAQARWRRRSRPPLLCPSRKLGLG